MTSKEEYDEKRRNEELEKAREIKNRQIKKYAKTALLITTIVITLGGGGWYMAKSGFFSYDPLNLCVQHTGVGMHIHPHLKIFVKGEKIKIPLNIGVSSTCMRPIHTHDESGTLHLEFPNKTDIALRNFFKIWGKPLSEFGTSPKMKVNGTENNEFENYTMRDGDQIELYFE